MVYIIASFYILGLPINTTYRSWSWLW